MLDFDGGKFRAPEFETIAQLEDAVAGALMNLLVERFQLTVTRPPFQVPRDLDVFVGREAQIAELTTALTHGTMTLVHGLSGVGGLGKSALAVHVAHPLRDSFTDGVLWVDLPTVRPAETLAAWAREYGGDVSRIEDLTARADALRTLLGGRRILAILDGAMDERDDANLTPLLRALADCAVVVTSRVTQLDSLRDAKPVDLDRMSEEDAWNLFVRMIGAQRLDGKRAVVRAIGGVVDFLPLALDLAASQMRDHHTWTADDLLAQLRDERGRLETLKWGDGKTRGVRASINTSYACLSADEQKFFVALGAFAGDDFDVSAAAFVTETMPEMARATLERLWRLSLAQEGRRADRYKLHPLLRDFVRERTTAPSTSSSTPLALRSESAQDALHRRMARYYCELAQENGPKLEGKEIYSALSILDTELSNIFAGQRWACAHDERVGWELCRDYFFGAMYLFNLRAMWSDWIEWGAAGIQASQKLDDVRAKGAIVGNLGLVYADKGEWDKAIEFHQKALGTMEKLGDIHGMAQTYGNLGLVYMQKGEWDKAIEFYQKSLGTKEQVGDIHGMAQTYINLGSLWIRRGDDERAKYFLDKAQTILHAIGDRYGIAMITLLYGGIAWAQHNDDDASVIFQEALSEFQRLGARYDALTCELLLTLLKGEHGDIDLPKATALARDLESGLASMGVTPASNLASAAIAMMEQGKFPQ